MNLQTVLDVCTDYYNPVIFFPFDTVSMSDRILDRRIMVEEALNTMCDMLNIDTNDHDWFLTEALEYSETSEAIDSGEFDADEVLKYLVAREALEEFLCK